MLILAPAWQLRRLVRTQHLLPNPPVLKSDARVLVLAQPATLCCQMLTPGLDWQSKKQARTLPLFSRELVPNANLTKSEQE